MTDSHSLASLPRSTPEMEGIASSALLAFLEEAEETLHELHSFQLLRYGHIVAEGWWTPYEADRPHMLFSLTKSFTSTAAGLAIAEGALSLDDTVLSFFPDEAPAHISENLAAMRVRHLLAMATGHTEDTTGHLFSREDGNCVKGFLELPVDRAPGSLFVYNSGASHIVSAIVQKVTGMRLQDYLQPRLFTPLGIPSPSWEADRRGINTGGWGLNLKTAEIARFGQLYLQNGVWEGRRLLPEGWVEEATSLRIAHREKLENDWSQGYGFQFWRCRHHAYRGDGAFGQFCLVLPEQEAVLAITAGIGDMQSMLDLVWKRLLPAMEPTSLPEDAAAQKALHERLVDLTLSAPQGMASSPMTETISGRTYHLEENDLRIEAVTLEFRSNENVLRIITEQGEQQIVCGSDGAWPRGTTTLENLGGASLSALRPVAASGAWTAEDTYEIKICYYETPFCPTMTCRFVDDRLLLDYRVNVSFGPKERPQMVGKRV